MDQALALPATRTTNITVDDLWRLMNDGIVEEGGRDELIGGKIVRRDGRWASESYVLTELAMRWHDRLATLDLPLDALAGLTIAIPPSDAPDAGAGITRHSATDPFFIATDVVLLLDTVRTGTTGLRPDRQRLYARAGIPEYWVVDVTKGEVHRFANPRDGEYRADPPVPLAGPLQSLTMPDLLIDGSGIL